MRIVIAGGTGSLGRALAEALVARGDQVVVLSRSGPAAPPPGRVWASAEAQRTVGWTASPNLEGWHHVVDDADAVVNLAGESIASGRWTAARKARIERSRIDATAGVVAAITASPAPPPRFVSGSAVGYDGNRGDEVLTEESRSSDDFLGALARRWEATAAEAQQGGTTVALVRTGIVLDPDSGVLASLAPVFKLYAGGPAGSGRQYMSWIHRDDWVRLVVWLLDGRMEGAFNATAPAPATNAEFSRAVGRVWDRPSWMPTPGFVVRLVLGEMGDALLLGGQRVLPARAEAEGFTFRFTDIDAALGDLYKDRR